MLNEKKSDLPKMDDHFVVQEPIEVQKRTRGYLTGQRKAIHKAVIGQRKYERKERRKRERLIEDAKSNFMFTKRKPDLFKDVKIKDE